jgi:hypothetical protein
MSKATWLSAAVLLSLPAFAGTPLNMQPGLYEMKTVKIIQDGVDQTSQMSDAMAKMQEKLAAMPPEQRAQVEAMMQQHGMKMDAGNNSFQMCMTQAQIDKHSLPVSKDNHCEPTYTQSGSTFTFTYNCPLGNGTSSGKGTATRSGDSISIVSDGTITGSGGTHVTHTELQMNYLGSSCGAVKPIGAAQ